MVEAAGVKRAGRSKETEYFVGRFVTGDRVGLMFYNAAFVREPKLALEEECSIWHPKPRLQTGLP